MSVQHEATDLPTKNADAERVSIDALDEDALKLVITCRETCKGLNCAGMGRAETYLR